MATKNLIPRGDGEGGIGKSNTAWGKAYFKTGYFDKIEVDGVEPAFFETDGSLNVDGSINVDGGINYSGHLMPATNADFDIGSAEKKVRHLFLSDNSLYIGDNELEIKSEGNNLILPSGIKIGTDGAQLSGDINGRILFGEEGLLVGQAEVKPDPTDPTSLYFEKAPQVKDSEGQPVTILTADKLGLGTEDVLEEIEDDLKFKLLTDQNRFVVGTSGNAEGTIASGWYRFNDFKVKGATDIGAHPINPVDTRIYSDESSFILFKTDVAGNRVAHLVGGNEVVTPNNAIALGIAVKVDEAEYPEDIEFVHTDGESYSVINGNSDSLGSNGLPIRQGFQAPSIGSSAAPLLIDGGSF
tara:strand:+ start:5631 stop:6695 length:1065 start_codon:yes stop_codon:yes gene_type:complete